MKSRMIKLLTCLFAAGMIMTGTAGSVIAAPAAGEAAESTAAEGTLSPVSGVSLLLAQVADQSSADAAEQDVQEAQAAQPAETEQTDETAQAEEEEKSETLGVTQVDKYVNIRSEASTDSKVVGKLKKNGVATVIKEKDGWYKVKSGSIRGYIKKEYLTVGDAALLDSVKYRVAEVKTETLRVRENASGDADVITLVSGDDKLKVVSEKNEGWVKVKTSEGKGYVSADYVKVYDTYKYAEGIHSGNGSDSGSGGSSVASYALQFVGNPYVWGGTSLTHGADCSGFIMSVYAHYGVSLPHSSSALRGVGRGVSYSEAQPGDIICYSGHVALYIGGGQIVHASNHRDGIKVSSATYKSILAVRRIF